jgi:hypothetical protein
MLKTRTTKVAACLAATAAGVLLLASCAKQGLGDNSSCNYLVLPGFADGGTGIIQTFADDPSDVIMDVDVQIELASPSEGAGPVPDPTVRTNFLLTHYDVTYRNNNTGGTTPGVDVPFPLHQGIQGAAVLPGELISYINIPVLTAGQKEVAPLNRADFYPPGGVSIDALMTWWGHPAVDDEAWCYGTNLWTFRIDRL